MGEFTIFDTLNTTVIAMLMVFTLLIVLMGIIYFQTYLINKFGNKKKVKVVDASEESLKEEEIFEDSSSDEEVVAAIMAVLSCYMDIPKNKIKIKSIKRVQGDTSTWGNAGLQSRVK